MKVYTLEEISEMLKIPIITLRKYLKIGKLKGAKIGKHWRITDEQLKEFVDSAIEEGKEIIKNRLESKQ